MAVGTFTLYSANKDDIRINDLTGATIKAALVSSGYTPDTSQTGHSLYSSVSANELATANGYTNGGFTLTSLTATGITNGWKFSSGNPSWTASGGNISAFRYVVFYVLGTLWGQTNPLIGYFVGDNTPADIPATLSGNTLTITCPANGWFDIT